MSIISAAFNRSRTALSLMLFILIAGSLAYINIPKESDPDIDIPIIYVSLHHEGISPEDAERLLVRPIEKEVRTIEGIKEMRSTAYEGGANVLLEFDAGFNADNALDDVREKVDLAKPELPDDTDEPTVHEVNLSQFPVLVVTLYGEVPERTLLKVANDLKDDVEAVPAVLEVNIIGDRDEAVEVIINPMKMESYNINADDVFNSLSRSNILIAAGAMDTGQGRFSVKVPGLFESARDILEMPLKVEGDSIITIGDVAELRKTFKDPTNFARVNGRPAVTLEVSKRTGENIIDTIARVRTIVDEAATRFPTGVEYGFSQDKSNNIKDMLTDLQNNVTSAILLVMIVIMGALGLRGGLLVGLAIPGSFLAGVLFLYTIGLTVNVVVLFALILSVGMLVDGAIVVTEYADRKLAEGETKEVAYGLAAKRMAWPIIASTATTLAAFLPLLFWPDIVGEFMKYLPITLIATLTASLAMALVFIPVLGANLAGVLRLVVTVALAVAGGALGMGLVGAIAESAAMVGVLLALPAIFLGWWLGGIMGRLLEQTNVDPAIAQELSAGHGDEGLNNVKGGAKVYLTILKGTLRFPTLTLGLGIAVLIGTYAVYGQIGKGVEFFPNIEPEQGIINIHARGNLSVREKNALVAEVENRVLQLQAERSEFKTIYTSAGNFESSDDTAEDIIGKIQLEFEAWDERRPYTKITADLRSRTEDLTGIWIEHQQQREGPQQGKPIHLEFSSWNPDAIDPVLDEARAYLETVDGLVEIEDSRPIPGIEWELDVDRAQAAKFGADIVTIGNVIQLVTKGLKISDYRPDSSDDEVDILARYPVKYRTLDQLDNIRINTSFGMIPVSNFITRTPIQKTGLLRRTDAKRIMFLKADVADGVNVDAKVKEIQAALSQFQLPEGVDVVFKGDNEDQKRSQDFLISAFTVALFLMALILVTQFNSFYSAFLILFAVIMSTAGVFIGLMIIDEPFGIVMSGVGVIALAGIVVNNNIVLIDTFDRLITTEKDARTAILLTGAQRLRPVMLTTITTILGLMPMVMQININFFTREITQGAPSTQWWVQLSTAIAFGLAFATVLTLILTPCALMLRANLKDWRNNRKQQKADIQKQDKESEEVWQPKSDDTGTQAAE
ncbi:MAG: efflux RND transporter permease subunit [Alphaproteobacteria bacterium]|nr:efflux RND transporter permease subunit [Alphaproteobacteria bacterium]